MNVTEQINPYIRRAWYDVIKPGAFIRERVIYDYELLYIKEGAAVITVGDDVFEGRHGDLFLFKPGQRHSIRITGNTPFVQPHIHFDLLFYPDRAEVPISFKNLPEMDETEKRWIREDVSDAFISPFPCHLRPHSPLYIEQLIFDVIHAYNNASLFSEIRLKWTFLRLWEHLLSEISYLREPTADAGQREAMRMVKTYLENNVDRKVTLDKVAQVVYMSKSYVSRMFRQTYQISPLNYHKALRVKKARDMIRYTNLSLTEIANMTGFETLQDFSRVFKKYENVPPSFYRRHITEGAAADA